MALFKLVCWAIIDLVKVQNNDLWFMNQIKTFAIKILENLSKIMNQNFLMWLAYCNSCDSLLYNKVTVTVTYFIGEFNIYLFWIIAKVVKFVWLYELFACNYSVQHECSNGLDTFEILLTISFTINKLLHVQKCFHDISLLNHG